MLADLIARPAGASIAELVEATGWRAHSVRGVISAVLRKKQGLSIEVGPNADGSRVYRLERASAR